MTGPGRISASLATTSDQRSSSAITQDMQAYAPQTTELKSTIRK